MRIFRKTNPEGLPRAADYGRVVALLQRLPYQKTKPKGLPLRVWVLLVGLFRSLLQLIADDLKD